MISRGKEEHGTFQEQKSQPAPPTKRKPPVAVPGRKPPRALPAPEPEPEPEQETEPAHKHKTKHPRYIEKRILKQSK